MTLRRLILTLIVVVTGASTFFAAAAALGLTTTQVGAGNVSVGKCDTDGFTVSYATAGGNVSSVTVGDIADPGCEAGVLRVTLTNSSGSSIGSGSGTIPTDGDTAPNSLVVTVSPTPAEGNLAAIQMAIEGP